MFEATIMLHSANFARCASPSAKVLTGLVLEGRPRSLGFAGASGCSDVRGKSGVTFAW